MKNKKFIKLLSNCGFTNNGDTIEKCLAVNKKFFQCNTFMLKSDILGCELLLNNRLPNSISDVFYYGTFDKLTQFREDLTVENIITAKIENDIIPRIEFRSGGIKSVFSDEENHRLIILFTQKQLEVFLKHVLVKAKISTIEKFVSVQNLTNSKIYFTDKDKSALIDLEDFDGASLQIGLSKNNDKVKYVMWNYEIQPLGNIPRDIESFFDYIKTTVHPFKLK